MSTGGSRGIRSSQASPILARQKGDGCRSMLTFYVLALGFSVVAGCLVCLALRVLPRY